MTSSNPGYIDLQVNGYAGVDFNRDGLTDSELLRACERLGADGVDGILATVITDDLDRMAGRLQRIADIRRREPLVRELVLGLHLEGPFISEAPGYVGAHPAVFTRPASPGELDRLLRAGDDLVRVVTLAPERDPDGAVIRKLSALGIIASAGHCNPTIEELGNAVDAGLSMFTHLGNGCPMTLHRHDNVIQRALHFSGRLWFTFIADGAHVPFPALGNYLRCAGADHCIVVSDAIAAAGMGPGRYTLGGQSVEVGEDGVVWAADRSHFVGAAATLRQAEERLVRQLGLSQTAASALTRENPRRALGLD